MKTSGLGYKLATPDTEPVHDSHPAAADTSSAVRPSAASVYDELIRLLDAHGARYEVLTHEPIGTTEVVSRLRGNPVEQAAKCLVLVVKLDRRTRRYVLAVVAGDSKVDLAAVAALFNARYAGFADPATAERLARSVPGTVLPFPMSPEIEFSR